MSGDTFDRLLFFQDLAPSQVALLRKWFIPCDFYPDATIFEQGDLAQSLYLVVSGEVVVSFKPYDGPPIVVARVTSGGVVGWSAALGSKEYTSSAYASTYSQALRIQGSDLRNLVAQYPLLGAQVLDRLAALIAERLRNTHPQVLAMLKKGLAVPATV